VKLLLDTHVWLWWHLAPARLSPALRQAVADTRNEVFLSTVSTWEMAIKIAAGKLTLPKPLAEMVPDCLLADGMSSLPLQHHHAAELLTLPIHHRDPFDRMLIAQARAEGATLASTDQHMARYDVSVMA
jgi:PIN domain nuclease of toxin-antitoxin system